MLERFADDSCPIPSEVVPTTYREGTQRWLYFIDRSCQIPSRNLRDLVLLPCEPHELPYLYCVTLGIHNAPGATAAGTHLMRQFGLSLKFEQAYDSLAGDVGSKTCAVVFPPPKTPREFDEFVAEHVARKGPSSRLIRQAAQRCEDVEAEYSTRVEAFFGQFIHARRYLPPGAEVTPIGQVGIQANPQTINKAPQSLALRLNNPQSDEVNHRLRLVYGHENGLEGRYVHVTCDTDLEALSFSFLDPDDILCWISVRFRGHIDEVNAVVRWLGHRGVDFRQYQIVENRSETGFDFELVCDLAQTDLHLFDKCTLRELLWAELERQLSPYNGVGTLLRELDVSYMHDTLILYNKFTESHRFHLLSVLVLSTDSSLIDAWPGPEQTPELLEWVAQRCAVASVTPERFPVPNTPRRYLAIARHPGNRYVVAAVFDNQPPPSFLKHLGRFCAHVPDPVKGPELAAAVRKYLLRDLRYDFLPSREQFKQLGTGPREHFVNDNVERFSSLGWDYVREKWERDHFPIRGNLTLANMLGAYLADQPELRARLVQRYSEPVRILDVGPGVGAITTVLMLRGNPLLWDNLDRLDLVFVDSAQAVLDHNRVPGEYPKLPAPLLELLQISHEEELDRLIGLLHRATYVCCDVSDPQAARRALTADGAQPFDIVYSGFCHHHMNTEMRAGACHTMLEWARDGAFLGIVDESLTYKQYLLYRIGHSLDEVALATESYCASPEEHARNFGERLKVQGREHNPGSKFYAFWGHVMPPLRLADGRQRKENGGAPATASEPVFDVFLSYNRDDRELLREINQSLRAARIATWFDEDQLEGGQIWQVELEKQVERVPKACVFVGPHGRGPWQDEEMRALLNEAVERGCTVIPVLLPGAPDEPDVPRFLRARSWVDLRTDYETNLGRLIRTLKLP